MAKINVKHAQLDAEELEHELPMAGVEEDGNGAGAEQVEAAKIPPPQEDSLEKLKTERDLLYDRLARQQAEFENFRKRRAREQQEFKEYAVAEAVKSLLPVLDSLDLALKNSVGEKTEIHSGVELVRKQFADALAKLGLREIPAEGEPFDPQLHQAIEMVETDEAPDHHVFQELQRGYKLKDRLLRAAMVRVARNPNPS